VGGNIGMPPAAMVMLATSCVGEMKFTPCALHPAIAEEKSGIGISADNATLERSAVMTPTSPALSIAVDADITCGAPQFRAKI
jgi:hypothetical protein